MKTFLTLAFLNLLLFTPSLNGQSPVPDNQALSKQWLGNWKAEWAKDTFAYVTGKSFFDGYEFYIFIETKGKKIFEQKTLMGYDKATGKMVEACISNQRGDIWEMVLWFTSPTECREVMREDLDKPGKERLIWNIEFKTPDLMIWDELVGHGHYEFHRQS